MASGKHSWEGCLSGSARRSDSLPVGAKTVGSARHFAHPGTWYQVAAGPGENNHHRNTP